MALAPANSASTDPAAGAGESGVHAPGLEAFVFAVFFGWMLVMSTAILKVIAADKRAAVAPRLAMEAQRA